MRTVEDCLSDTVLGKEQATVQVSRLCSAGDLGSILKFLCSGICWIYADIQSKSDMKRKEESWSREAVGALWPPPGTASGRGDVIIDKTSSSLSSNFHARASFQDASVSGVFSLGFIIFKSLADYFIAIS